MILSTDQSAACTSQDKRERMKWKEFESNQCSVTLEERHLTSSEGKNRGNTGRIQKRSKGCFILLQATHGPFGRQHLLSPTLKI